MPALSEKALVDDLERRLARKYAQLAPDHISTAVQQALARFEHSPVRDFVPLLVERRTRAELSRQTALVGATG